MNNESFEIDLKNMTADLFGIPVKNRVDNFRVDRIDWRTYDKPCFYRGEMNQCPGWDCILRISVTHNGNQFLISQNQICEWLRHN